MKKFIILLIVIVLAGGGVYYYKTKMGDAGAGAGGPSGPGGMGGMMGGPGGAMPPQEVGVVTIHPQSVNFTRDLPGRTTSYRIAQIRPQVSGIITKRLFEEGSEVAQGDQLYQIDPATYQAAYDSARANLMSAEATFKSAQAKFARYAQLVKQGAVSKQAFDDVQAALGENKAAIGVAKAAVTTAKIDLDRTKVFSPISGRIGKSLVTEGALVTANQADALATVQQFDPIYVDVTQSTSELMELRKQLNDAQKAPVTLLLDGQTNVYAQKGELQFSDVSVDPTTGSVQLRVLFPNPDHTLLPGLFVRARIEQARADNAILVSQKALTRNADNTTTVWLVGEGDKVTAQKITVSQAIGDQWLVMDGLKDGDRVVVEGTQKVAQDAVVKPVEANAAPETAPPTAEGAVAPEPVAEPVVPDVNPSSSEGQVNVEDDMIVPSDDAAAPVNDASSMPVPSVNGSRAAPEPETVPAVVDAPPQPTMDAPAAEAPKE